MEAAIKSETKSERWKRIVEGSSRRRGSLQDYCDQEAISYFQFNYWRKKIGEGTKSVPRVKIRAKVVPSFVPVKIEVPEKAESVTADVQATCFPDAKWVAEVIFNVMRMSQ